LNDAQRIGIAEVQEIEFRQPGN